MASSDLVLVELRVEGAHVVVAPRPRRAAAQQQPAHARVQPEAHRGLLQQRQPEQTAEQLQVEQLPRLGEGGGEGEGWGVGVRVLVLVRVGVS